MSPPVTDVPILSRMLTASTANTHHDPTRVHHGFVVNGFVQPPPAHLLPIVDAVGPRMLKLLRDHITTHTTSELCHCVLTDCKPFKPQTVEVVSMWHQVALNPIEEYDNIFVSVAGPAHHLFITFYPATDGSIDAVLSGRELDDVYQTVCMMSHHNLLSRESCAITYPTHVR